MIPGSVGVPVPLRLYFYLKKSGTGNSRTALNFNSSKNGEAGRFLESTTTMSKKSITSLVSLCTAIGAIRCSSVEFWSRE